MTGQVSNTEVKRWALDASDWLWGTVQGAFNEKQTTSQIIIDAVIGMIPLVGDVTAARDLIAVGSRLANEPQKREQVSEWVLLIILIFALIPVVGGIIKGVGRLLLKVGENAVENQKVLGEIIGFLNRFNHGNSVKWFRELRIARYQSELIAKFNAFIDKLVEALSAIKSKLGWFIPKEMARAIDTWTAEFKALKPLAGKMIPQAVKELDTRLRVVQSMVYQGEWHVVQPGIKNTTFEHEVRLIEGGPKLKPKRVGWKQNRFDDYQHVDEWPDLRKKVKREKGKPERYEAIEAFSGPMTAVTLKGPKTIYRVLRPKGLENGDNALASPWWTETLPPNAKAWREGLGVLGKYNKNSYYIKYHLQAGEELKAWRGKASEQFDANSGQYLPGGDYQLFIDLRPQIVEKINRLPLEFTHWPDAEVLYGVDSSADTAYHVRTEKLGRYEIESKRAPVNSPAVAGARAYAAHERAQDAQTK